MLFKADRHGNTMKESKTNNKTETNNYFTGEKKKIVTLIIACCLVSLAILGVLLIRIVEINTYLVIILISSIILVGLITCATFLYKQEKQVHGLWILFGSLVFILGGLYFGSVERVRAALIIGLMIATAGIILLLLFALFRYKIVPNDTIIIQTKGKDNDKNVQPFFPGARFFHIPNTKLHWLNNPHKHIRHFVNCYSRDDYPIQIIFSIYWQIEKEPEVLLKWSKALSIEELIKDMAEGMIGFNIAKKHFANIRICHDQIRDDAEAAIKYYLEKDLKIKFVICIVN